MKVRIVAATLFFLAVFTACTATRETPGDDGRYRVDIRWTSFGIPHVKAGDWGSLGYGFAYATLTDGACVFAHEVATANGTLSADFGRTDEHLSSDVFHRALLTDDRLRRYSAALSPDNRAFNTGFVAGYNRFLRDGDLPASCDGQSWVRPITEADLGRTLIAFGIRYGLGQFKDGIAAAAPPGQAHASMKLSIERMPAIGSNAIALGGELTESGRGLLLGNPHYPWHGASRFHMIHATIPGVVDSMGASLLAGSFIGIGFNKDIAWTHTVSTAARFTIYELDINPGNAMQYRYGGEYRDIEARIVRVPAADDGVSSEERTVYFSHYGPLVIGEALPWTRDRAYAVRDAIYDNNAAMASYEALQTAESVADVEAAISRQGVFFVNTIAADRHGNAFYADVSSTPNLDAEQLGRCRRGVEGLPPFVPVLDGAEPGCEWQNDPRSAIPGAMPADVMPRATARDFFTNSNDSYWLSNPGRPLEGYSPIIGPEGTPRSLRTRAGLTYLREQIEKDGKLGPADVQRLLYSHRHFGAELLLDDVLTICAEDADDIAASCEVLANWDRTATTASRGTQVWTEFWEIARLQSGSYAVPFDVEDPVNTPRGLDIEDPETRAALRESLALAERRLRDAGVPLDARWGDLQFAERNGERIPIPGAPGWHGVFSYIDTDFTDGKGYTPIQAGNSYIQVISWDKDGTLDARGILTYSQSPEPDSPHYADQTRLYSAGKWLELPFTEQEIESDPELRTLTLSE